MVCGLTRMAQVHGYAIKLVCELTNDPHLWHWDSSFMAEWAEPDPRAKLPTITIRTSSVEYKQPVVA